MLAFVGGHISSQNREMSPHRPCVRCAAIWTARLAFNRLTFVPRGTAERLARVDRVRWTLAIGDWRSCPPEPWWFSLLPNDKHTHEVLSLSAWAHSAVVCSMRVWGHWAAATAAAGTAATATGTADLPQQQQQQLQLLQRRSRDKDTIIIMHSPQEKSRADMVVAMNLKDAASPPALARQEPCVQERAHMFLQCLFVLWIARSELQADGISLALTRVGCCDHAPATLWHVWFFLAFFRGDEGRSNAAFAATNRGTMIKEHLHVRPSIKAKYVNIEKSDLHM